MKNKKIIKNQNCAVGYCRYSSEGQREESITAQKREIQKYAIEKDINIVGWYIDRATTGTSADRAEWTRLKNDSAQGQFGLVLVHKENRFSRQEVGAQYEEEKFLFENGVQLVSVSERFDNTPTGRSR